MSSSSVQCVQQANALLGEGPVWQRDQGTLYWVDIRRPAIFRWEPLVGQTGYWPLPVPIGCVSPTRSGSLIFADADGLASLDLDTLALARIAHLESDLPRNRFNDGKVDRAGRLWIGSMDDKCLEPTGSLYRVNTDFSIHKMDTGFVCSNGIGWSPDNRLMYFTDSMVRTIWIYEFDLQSGSLGERRVFARLSDRDGVPDGLTVDSEGFVWSAIWDGWRLVRFAPDGTVDFEVPMPVQRPTSCIFGGSDLRTLYVTTASWELDAQSLSRGPLSGGLFAVQLKTTGLPETPFG